MKKMTTTNMKKILKKAFAYAHANGIEYNNYPVSKAWVIGNGFHAIFINEYGSSWDVLHIYGKANWIFTHREVEILRREA